jgi:hypothetical protein
MEKITKRHILKIVVEGHFSVPFGIGRKRQEHSRRKALRQKPSGRPRSAKLSGTIRRDHRWPNAWPMVACLCRISVRRRGDQSCFTFLHY